MRGFHATTTARAGHADEVVALLLDAPALAAARVARTGRLSRLLS
ncbi:MAG: hypothetical protein SYR96_24530 [Actinomycetota bacterium]|nr:hypothetical protein [Actinomycetota bacterium]